MAIVGRYLLVFPVLMPFLVPREEVASNKPLSAARINPTNKLVGAGIYSTKRDKRKFGGIAGHLRFS
jgi:hypothetical protein